MTEIKTIMEKVTNTNDNSVKMFDEKVNIALKEGFVLKKREFREEIPTTDGEYIFAKLYAELERTVD